jgi:hypothetical protein
METRITPYPPQVLKIRNIDTKRIIYDSVSFDTLTLCDDLIVEGNCKCKELNDDTNLFEDKHFVFKVIAPKAHIARISSGHNHSDECYSLSIFTTNSSDSIIDFNFTNHKDCFELTDTIYQWLKGSER